MKIVFSAIQPTGVVHIGNYFGAISQWLSLAKNENYQCIYAIADLHALTEPIPPQTLSQNIIKTASTFLALGLDYKKVIFFIQSSVSEHTELAWLLNTVTPVGDLKRMTQFKDKAKQFKGPVNAGLLNYPILMAADILLYKALLVPVGKDQLQHLELTREIARRFNKRFGKTFPLPTALIEKKGAKIMSLTEPTKKMSKSKGEENYLGIFEKPEKIREKILKAVTDSGKEIKYLPSAKPGISNLMKIYSLLTGKSFKEIEKEFKNKNYLEFKKILAETFIDYFKKPRKEYEKLLKNKEKIKKILFLGHKKAKKIASQNLLQIKKKCGLIL